LLDLDLKKIEKKYFKTLTESGTLDFFSGALYLGGGILSYIEKILPNMGLSFIYGLIVIAMMVIFDNKIIRPRTGIIRFKHPPKSRIIKIVAFSILMIAGGFLGLFILLIIPKNPFVELLELIVLSLWVMPSIFHVFSYGFKNIRFSIIGLIYGLNFFLDRFIDDLMGIYLYSLIISCTIGAVLIIIGTILIIRFLRKYPIRPKFEDINDK